MSITAQSVWNNCLLFIKDNIQPQAYKTWFEPIVAVKLTDNALSIQVPSKFFYEWLEEHYVKLLKVALKATLTDSEHVLINGVNGHTYTILSITFCETAGAAETFDLYIDDDGGGTDIDLNERCEGDIDLSYNFYRDNDALYEIPYLPMDLQAVLI